MAEVAARRPRRKLKSDKVEPFPDTESEASAGTPLEAPKLENFTAWSEEGEPAEILELEDANKTDTTSLPRSRATKQNEDSASGSGTPFGSRTMLQKMKKNIVVPHETEDSKDGIVNPVFVKEKIMPADAWDGHEADNEASRPNTAPTAQADKPLMHRPMSAPPKKVPRSHESSPKHIEDLLPEEVMENNSINGSKQSLYAWGTKGDEIAYRNSLNKLNNLGSKESVREAEGNNIANKEADVISNGSHGDKREAESTSSVMLAPPQAMGEQHAYVPLEYAKDCISKVVDDMKRMKAKHVGIVEQIQGHYKSIEEDTQGQFNAYVLQLRTEYGNKLSTFRKIIETYQNEMTKKQTYWENMVESLRKSNKKLLQEKKDLLIRNRNEFNEIEEEKLQAVNNLTNMLDKKHADYLIMEEKLRDEEKLLDSKEQSFKNREEDLEAKNKMLQEEMGTYRITNESEKEALNKTIEEQKAECENLRQKILAMESEKEQLSAAMNTESSRQSELLKDKEALNTSLSSLQEESDEIRKENERLKVRIKELEEKLKTTVAVVPVSVQLPESKTEESIAEAAPVTVEAEADENVAAAVVVESSEKKGDSEEIARLKKQLSKLKKAIKSAEEEKENHNTEKKELSDELAELRTSLTEHNMTIASLQSQNNDLHQKLRSAVEQVSMTADLEEVRAKMQAAEDERSQLEEECNELNQGIETWQVEFAESHNDQQPTEEDRTEEIQGAYQQIEENEKKLAVIKADIAFMQMILTGEVQGPTEDDGLKDKYESIISDLEREKATLSDENSELKDENERLRRNVEDLELNASTVTTTVSSTVDLGEGVEGLQIEIDVLNKRISSLVEEHEKEISAVHKELEENQSKLDDITQEKETAESKIHELETTIKVSEENFQTERTQLQEEIDTLKKKVNDLEEAKLANLPVEAASEIKTLRDKLDAEDVKKQALQKEISHLKTEAGELNGKLETANTALGHSKDKEATLKEEIKNLKSTHEDNLKTLRVKLQEQPKGQMSREERGKMKALERKVEDLEKKLADAKDAAKAGTATAAAPQARKEAKSSTAGDEKLKKENEKLLEKIEAYKKRTTDDGARIKQLEKDVKEAKEKASKAGPSTEEKMAAKKQEKQLKDLQKQLESEKKRTEKLKGDLTKTEEELAQMKKDMEALSAESKKDKDELSKLGVAVKQGLEAINKVEELESKVTELSTENKTLAENFNSERILRKKYYNMVEDMKGKIRVYARARPLSKSELDRGNYRIIKSPDEYTLIVDTARGPKEFQYDQVFTEMSTQEKIFEDVNNLIQSAVDGYNVCIFAYGQTGSGKTFTMIGDKELRFPGIAPRAFKSIYEVIAENSKKFSFRTEMYMLELYMDKLIDLFGTNKDAKLDIKKDKKGMVIVNGAVVLEAGNSEELMTLFEKGSSTRHISSTKMNAESSRSHLVVSIIIESTNLTSGTVTRGKLSLVDLAGSERAAKTGATPEQLKEAQSINKSLSALGDVISALSSEQSFIPYRNNKLTLLMQDSLGGNAKTLMFVNISPADYNSDETITSLTYASRVKLITNDASKNADNKEIARLKGVISKLKKGESVDDDDEEE